MNSNLVLSLNNAKDILRNKNDEGNSVYDHICDIINFIIVEEPSNCYDNFELISNYIKEKKRISNETLDIEDKEKKKSSIETYILDKHIKKKKEWLNKLKNIFLKNDKFEPQKLPYLIDMNEQIKLMNWAGYSISNNCAYYLNESSKNILEQYKNHIVSLKFWGIIKGIQKDYYILEAELKNTSNIFETKSLIISSDNSIDKEDEETQDENSKENDTEEESDKEKDEDEDEEEEEEEEDEEEEEENERSQKKKRNKEIEKKKKKKKRFLYEKEDYDYFNKNVNKHIYFVSLNGETEWIFLNFTDPETIKTAKKIHKMCTGNLEHLITSYPNIVMKEKNYLRAIVSIISAETHIAPQNYFTVSKKGEKKKNKNSNKETYDEDDEEEKNNEDDDYDNGKEDSDNVTDEEEKGDFNGKNLVKNKTFKFDLNSLKLLENWVHYKYGFLPNGHINYPKNVKKGKNKKNKKIQNMLRKKPPLKILRNIIIEEKEKKTKEWKINHLNPGHYYGNDNVHYDVIIISNLSFYGAFTIYFNKRFSNFYIGTGLKTFNTILHSYAPAKVQSDQSELSETEFLDNQ